MSEDMKEKMAVPVADGTMPKESDEERLTRLAGEINAIKEQTRATVQNATLEIGRRLIQAKAAVPHGSWAYWLKTSVDYSERTAQMLMSTYERFGNAQQKLFGTKMDPELVNQLNRSQMFALLSIKSEEECAEFMEEHKDDLADMSKRELEKAIKERDEARANLEKWRKSNEELGDTAQRVVAEKEKLKEKLRKMTAETKETKGEMKRLQEEMAERTARIADLEKHLQEAQHADVEVGAVVERMPEEAEQEIKNLRAKIAELEEQQGKEAISLDFKRHFENMKGEFNAMNEALDTMEPDQRKRYRAAMKKMMDMMLQIVG
nr:MAG TPA: Protein of unknown function (DUF3102) [Caudoviricetes sp.]